MAAKRSNKKVTLVDVAKHAGVSRATASLVLRNSPLVADSTRETVLASMKALGYVYNRAAANLRSQRTRTIGLVVTDITNPFFAELSIHIESQLSNADYTVLLGNTMDNIEKQDRLLKTMNGYQVDGILFCPADGTQPELIDLLNQWKLPFVLVARRVAERTVDYAGANNVAGAELAVEHLHAQGHHRIAFLGGQRHSSARKERLEGYLNILKKYDLDVLSMPSVIGPVTRQGGFEAMLSILNEPNPPTAAFCYNDVVAFGAMLALQSKNLTPGRDFSIVGFDDVTDAALMSPALSTVAIPSQDIAKAAIDLLLERIDAPDSEPKSTFLPPSLIVRSSS